MGEPTSRWDRTRAGLDGYDGYGDRLVGGGAGNQQRRTPSRGRSAPSSDQGEVLFSADVVTAGPSPRWFAPRAGQLVDVLAAIDVAGSVALHLELDGTTIASLSSTTTDPVTVELGDLFAAGAALAVVVDTVDVGTAGLLVQVRYR